jgi:hypothetical protein
LQSTHSGFVSNKIECAKLLEFAHYLRKVLMSECFAIPNQKIIFCPGFNLSLSAVSCGGRLWDLSLGLLGIVADGLLGLCVCVVVIVVGKWPNY